jgi:hypothetical protein
MEMAFSTPLQLKHHQPQNSDEEFNTQALVSLGSSNKKGVPQTLYVRSKLL